MSLSITCPNCDRKLNVKDELAGKKVRCPDCSAVISIPRKSLPSFEEDEPAPAPRKRQPPRIKREEPAPPKRRQKPVEEDDYFPDIEDDEELVPTRKRKKKRGAQIELGSVLMMIVKYSLAAFGLLIVMAAIFTIATMLPLLVLAVGLLVYVVGSLWLVIVPFEDGALEGLLCLFLPLYILYYIANNFDKMKAPFLVSIAGFFLLMTGACAGGANNAKRQGRGAYFQSPGESLVFCEKVIVEEALHRNVWG